MDDAGAGGGERNGGVMSEETKAREGLMSVLASLSAGMSQTSET